jgi:hypothetical protein
VARQVHQQRHDRLHSIAGVYDSVTFHVKTTPANEKSLREIMGGYTSIAYSDGFVTRNELSRMLSAKSHREQRVQYWEPQPIPPSRHAMSMVDLSGFLLLKSGNYQ